MAFSVSIHGVVRDAINKRVRACVLATHQIEKRDLVVLVECSSSYSTLVRFRSMAQCHHRLTVAEQGTRRHHAQQQWPGAIERR